MKHNKVPTTFAHKMQTSSYKHTTSYYTEQVITHVFRGVHAARVMTHCTRMSTFENVIVYSFNSVYMALTILQIMETMFMYSHKIIYACNITSIIKKK